MIDIPALHDPDVERFIERIAKYVRKPDFDADVAAAAAQGTTKEKVLTASFPFTEEAIDALKSKTQLLTPREITLQMTRALGRAHRQQRLAITSDCVV